jgi:hypothetical protein
MIAERATPPRDATRRPAGCVSLLVAAFALVLTACGGGSSDTNGSDTNGDGAKQPVSSESTRGPVEVEQIAESPVEDTPSGLAAARGGVVEGLPDPVVPIEELRSGGPPPDGIPPIDEPKFLAARDVDFLADNEPVMVVDIDGDTRAYPVQILIWHEIVNDTVGGVPVALTYCPLCNSAVAYDRRVADRVVSFGTSGLLWNSALVMYDRQTETLWSHFNGDAILGVLAGTDLKTFPVSIAPWSLWRDANPDGLVLSRETGFDRDYGANPYPGYDDIDSQPFLFEGSVDGRFTAMTRVVGIETDTSAVAVPLVRLRADSVVPITLDGRDLTVWWAAGTASALDASDIADGDDVGATGVFVPVVDGKTLSFRAENGSFIDNETGTTWNLLGTAVSGPLEGRRLEQVAHVDTFWFAWSTFRADTTVVPVA